MRSFGIARMGVQPAWLPRRQSWVGKLKPRNGLVTVTVVLFGGAGLTVTCRHLLSETRVAPGGRAHQNHPPSSPRSDEVPLAVLGFRSRELAGGVSSPLPLELPHGEGGHRRERCPRCRGHHKM